MEGLRELRGVQHCKTMIRDNDVFLSSTNHGGAYYRHRADRYWMVRDAKPLADYLWEFGEMMLDNSFICDHNQNLVLRSHIPHPEKDTE
jgi:hypothetical protein